MNLATIKPPRLERATFVFFSALFFAIVFFQICIIDDSYISFRVVDNAVNGFGLRWNVDERVQAYTHPLWLLLHIPLYAVFGNIYWVTIFLSLIFGVLAIRVLLRLLPPGHLYGGLALVLLPLVCSRIFRNYVVCGLENPLSFFLFAWVLYEVFARDALRLQRIFFIAALAVITRFDNALILLPLCTVLWFAYREKISFKQLLIAGSPIILWHSFSLFYYGFLFPNTKYAKLYMGVGTSEYLRQGMVYLANLPKTDPLACLLIFSALILMLSYGRQMRNLKDRSTHYFLLGVGFVIQLAYVVSVGGDFMPGRFFANMLIVSVGVLALHVSGKGKKATRVFALLVLLVTTADQIIIQPNLPNRVLEELNGGIDDQHDYYYGVSGMLSDPYHILRREPRSPMLEDMKTIRAGMGDNFRYHTATVSGMKFYYGGPYIVILDMVGLADALMARRPTGDISHWRIGHPIRVAPDGYSYARQTGDTSMMDPPMARYYEKLRLLTEADLFSWERMKAIAGFQLGLYDHWLKEYQDLKSN